MSYSLHVKICGITKPAQGRAIAKLARVNADLLSTYSLGFICARSSPRYVTAEQIRQIVDVLETESLMGLIDVEALETDLEVKAIRTHASTLTAEPQIGRVGVFVDASLEELVTVAKIGKLSAVQLHGNESLQYCQQVRIALPQLEIVKAIRVRDPEMLARSNRYVGFVDSLLLDAYHPTQHGGTGKTLNWETLRQFRPGCPWFLAGGLTPDNVLEALSRVRPNGIDLSSGVERSPGDKDLEKVAYLFDQLKMRALA